MEQRPQLPIDLPQQDRQRIELLQERFVQAQKQIEQMQNSEVDRVIERVDSLIEHLKSVEEQIRNNSTRPMSDYENLIIDCQVKQTVFLIANDVVCLHEAQPKQINVELDW